MDQSSNASVAAPRGHTYGDNSVDGNATVIFGDVHVNGQKLSEAEKLELKRKALYSALSYDGMHHRSEQLSLPQIPLQSFDWIWETQFSSWLVGEEPLFWISGKPGSGKSTLMQHLIKSNRTRQTLNGNGHRYTILSFFFDFRAGSMTANDSVGILKMFLSQLCMSDEGLERKLAERNATVSIDTAGFPILLDLFVDNSRLLGSDLCAFVDGLDEYHGHYTDLGNILAEIQNRTGMRLCVASRPESAFQELFKAHSSISIQDYNAASVRAYIDHAIRKGRETMARVDTVFDEAMRERLQRRAQGVIIWARLAVDELLRAACLDTSRELLEDILEHLPDELEAMYERSISQMRHSNYTEAALVLFLLNEFGGSLDINVLWGMWNFIASWVSVDQIPTRSVGHRADFLRRMATLIGPLFDFLHHSIEIRLMHKTLQTYLKRSVWVQDHLPRCFKDRYPDNFKLRLFSDVIEAATNADIIPFDHILQGLYGVRRENERPEFLRVRVLAGVGNRWKVRLDFLSYSIGQFSSQACALEKNGVSSFEICKNAMSSYLLLTDLRLLRFFSAWYRARRCGFLDLVIAIKRCLYRYVRDRLTGELLLDDRDWSELLRLAIHDREMLDLLRPHCNTVQADFLMVCGSISWEQDSTDLAEYLVRMLSKMRLPSPVRRFPLLCENDSCGNGDDLIHWWTRSCAGGRLSGTILRLILESGESINTRCKQAGTALHVLINECLVGGNLPTHCHDPIHPLGNYAVAKFATLARLGIDATIEHHGLTPLQLVQIAESKLGRGTIFRPYQPRYPSYDRDVRLIALALRQYDEEKNGQNGY